MKLGTIVIYSFFLSAAIGIWGVLRKIVHAPDADTFLYIGVALWMIFIISAIIEVRRSPRIPSSEKWMWTLSFIFFSGFAGLIYLLIGRRRIAS